MKRNPFSERYKDLHIRWGLDKIAIDYLVKEAQRQYEQEIMDTRPLTISDYFRDNRTDHEYYYDIIDGRLFEKIITLWLMMRGYEVRRSGADADDIIHRSKGIKIKSSADLTVEGWKLEIQISRGGYRPRYDVKDYKGKKIKAGENKMIFLTGDDYFFVKPDMLDDDKIYKNFAWNKYCYPIQHEECTFIKIKDPIDWI